MMETILGDVNYDPSSPASYGRKEAVYKRQQEALYPKITRERATTWLSKQFTYTVHKPARYHFKTNRIFAERIDYQWQADLVDLCLVQKYSDGLRYLLTCMDVFSKYSWAIPLRSKTCPSLISAHI